MYNVYVNLRTHKEIYPYQSQMGAIYFATLYVENHNINNVALPAIDVVNMETGEVVWWCAEELPAPIKSANSIPTKTPNNDIYIIGQGFDEYVFQQLADEKCPFVELGCNDCPYNGRCSEMD